MQTLREILSVMAEIEAEESNEKVMEESRRSIDLGKRGLDLQIKEYNRRVESRVYDKASLTKVFSLILQAATQLYGIEVIHNQAVEIKQRKAEKVLEN